MRRKCKRCGMPSKFAATHPSEKCFACCYNPKGNEQPVLPGFELSRGEDPLKAYLTKGTKRA